MVDKIEGTIDGDIEFKLDGNTVEMIVRNHLRKTWRGAVTVIPCIDRFGLPAYKARIENK